MAVIKHKEQRVAIFIDTQNLYHSAKNIYHAKVNFDAVVKAALVGKSVHSLRRSKKLVLKLKQKTSRYSLVVPKRLTGMWGLL